MNKPKKLCFFILVSAIILMMVHSCKKDLNNSKIQTSLDPVAMAKAWYEQSYANTSNTSVNRSLSESNASAGTRLFNYTKFISPNWKLAATYKRYNAGVVELPIDPSSSMVGTSVTSSTTTTPVYKSRFSRSSFLILNDSAGYHAYIMTLIADSAYLNGDLTKLDKNKYNKRDPAFSGVVIYNNPDGTYVNGWVYKNGTISFQLPQGEPSQSRALIKSGTINTASSPRALKIGPTDRLYATVTCTDWTQDCEVNGVNYGSVDMGTTCSIDITNDSGNATGSSGSGSASPVTPPPPCAVPSSGGGVEALVPRVAVTRVAQSPPPPVGGVGFPPPTTPPTDPCTQTTTTTHVPLPNTTPCAQAALLNTMSSNATIATQNASILSQTNSSGVEYGVDENVTSISGGAYIPMPVTRGTAGTWPPTFSWSTATGGYTIGWSHGHPGGSAPSPDDAFAIMTFLDNPALQTAGSQSVAFYMSNASVTVVTTAGTYTVTANNWANFQTAYNAFNTSTPASAATGNLNGYDTQYQTLGGDYLSSHPGATSAEAGAYALMTMLGDGINLYYAPAGSTTFTPLALQSDAGGNFTVTKLQCQ